VFAWLGGNANRPGSAEVDNRDPAGIAWQWLLCHPILAGRLFIA